MKDTWVAEQAIKLCVAIEAIAPRFGYHVALTGGLLYKNGFRKDCDLIFYRVRHSVGGRWKRLPLSYPDRESDRELLLKALTSELNMRIVSDWGAWKKIVEIGNQSIDLLFPDEE